MVELPNHDRKQGAFALCYQAFRRWLERDFNETRPLSSALAIVPLLPGLAASQFGWGDSVSTALLIAGSPFSIWWLGYVIYRSTSNNWRDARRAASDRRARKRGEEVPMRCPECGIDLPIFSPPRDGRSHRFIGWDCENCGTMIDQYGRSI
jgi:hypothetical protein